MAENQNRKKFGWRRDLPDIRHFTVSHTGLSMKLKEIGNQRSVSALLKKTGIGKPKAKKLPASVDLKKWCSPIEHQGNIGSCTAQAGVGLMEYFENRSFNKVLDASRLFLYKATRNLMKETGDVGGYLRFTMGAMALFGCRRKNTGLTMRRSSTRSRRHSATPMPRTTRACSITATIPAVPPKPRFWKA